MAHFKLGVGSFFNRKPELNTGSEKTVAFTSQGRSNKNVIGCIMGNVGFSAFGACPTKIQDIWDFTILFKNVSLVSLPAL